MFELDHTWKLLHRAYFPKGSFGDVLTIIYVEDLMKGIAQYYPSSSTLLTVDLGENSAMVDLVEFIKTIGPACAAIAAVLVTVIKFIKGSLDFHEDLFSRRPFRRLKFLADEIEGNAVLAQTIAAAKNEEFYKQIFGRYAAPNHMNAVHDLVTSGHFCIADLRAAHAHIHLENGKIKITIDAWDKAIFLISLLSISFSALFAITLIVLLLTDPSYPKLLTATGTGFVLLFFCWLMGPDLRSIATGKHLQKKLMRLDSNQH